MTRVQVRHRSSVLLIVLDTVQSVEHECLWLLSRDDAGAGPLGTERSALFSRLLHCSVDPFHPTLQYSPGRWPHQLSADWLVPLDRKTPVLAEYFRSRGYLDGGIRRQYAVLQL